MEELGVVDCPPTPEILPVSSTPPARHEITYSSSSEDPDESADGRRSPPPKCAICLGKCRQPSYTNSCSHRFCFQCLWEWSKVKPECPLCKQSFIEIAYRNRADSQPFITPVPRPLDEQRHEIYQQQLNFLLTDRAPHRFLYSTSLRVRPSQHELLQELFRHQSNDVQRFVREFGNQPIPSRLNTIGWRRFIYEQRLFARPLPDINGCFRDTSASFYQNNSTQLNRIMPWAERELFALNVPRSGIHIITMMQETDVDSHSFLEGLNNILPLQHRAHFQHELVNFARSPYDMIGYDRCVQYDPPFSVRPSLPASPLNFISSSEPDDDEVVFLPSSPEPAPASAGSSSNNNSNHSTSHSNGSQGSASSRRVGRTQFHIESRSSVQTVIMTGTLRESGAAAGASDGAVPLATTGTQTPQVIEVNDDAATPPSAQPSGTLMPRAGTSTLRDGDNIELSSSDSDECQFVREQKPPHLRTPDHVVDLESASDSDVVFVDEAGTIPAPKVSSAEGGTGDAAAASQTSQQDSLKKETSTGCLEYNQGASTSSGYCGGMSGGSGASGSGTTVGLRPRHYAMPSLNRYAGGIGMKSIYEASDTDDDSDGDRMLGSVFKGSSESSSASSSHEEFLFRSVQQQASRGRKRKRLVKRVAVPPPKQRAKKATRERAKSVSSDSSMDSGSSTSSRSSSSSSSSSSSTNSSSSRSSSTSSTNSSSSSTSSSSSSSSTTTTNRSLPSEAVVKSSKRRKRQTSSNPKDAAKRARSKKTRKSKQLARGTAKLPKDVPTPDVGVKSNRRKRSQQSPRPTPAASGSNKSSTKASSKGTTTKRRKKKAKTSDTRARGGKRTKRESKMEASPVIGDRKRDHYFVETRPSCSPTEETGSNRTRRLKSVIIKRCHYNRKPNTATATTTTTTTTMEEPSSAPVDVKISIRIPATVEATLNQEPSTSGLPPPVAQPMDDSTDRRQETAATLLQLSSPASDSGSDTAELDEHAWDILKFPLNVVLSGSEPARDQVPQHHPTGAAEETLQTQQSTDQSDHQQPFPLDGGGILMEEESNSIASESLFVPAASWELGGAGEASTVVHDDGGSSSHEPPLATATTEDRLSSAAASPFSSVSFPPSTASFSTSPTLSQAVPTRPPSPVELLDVVGTMDSESPLPSSVVDIGAIDGTIEDIMATPEEVPAIGEEEMPAVSDAPPSDGCVLEGVPEASAGTETVGAEVEL